MTTARLLTSADVRDLVRRVGIDVVMVELIERLDAAFATFDPEVTRIPTRSGFEYAYPAPGLLEWMPALEVGSEVTLKVVGYHPENPARNARPTILSTLLAFEVDSGALRAVADGTLLTTLRTGAASAVASRWLAHPESRVLGLIGCGAQAVTQAHALAKVFEFEEILVHDRSPEAEAGFAERVDGLVGAARVRALAPAELVGRCDVLCVATSIDVGAGPVFGAVETRPWLHVNAVGSDFPGKTELPRSLVEESFVCADFVDQALREGESQQLADRRRPAAIHEVAADPEAYAQMRRQRTIFDSTGWMVEDRVALRLALELADRFELGSRIEIEDGGGAPLDPYGFLRMAVARES